MNQFKVGDKVRIKKVQGLDNHGTTGIIGTIIEIDRDTSVPIQLAFDGVTFTGCRFFERELERVTDKITVEKIFGFDYQVSETLPESFLKSLGIGIERVKGSPVYSHEFSIISPNESMTQKVAKTMTSIIKKIKDIKLSQEDRLLRKHDFENDCGEMTEQSRDMMLDEILEEKWKTRRLEIAADLKLVEAQEK